MLSQQLAPYRPEVIIGPETLGRTFAGLIATWTETEIAVWCDIRETSNGQKLAVFPEKFDFAPLVAGKRVAVVDDLLNTGLTFQLTTQLVRQHGGKVVVACAPVCRTPGIRPEACGAPNLEVLAYTPPMVMYTPEECRLHGPCSTNVPMTLRPGQGWKWIKSHPGYPTI
jgi:orotate phosphoribosyltransferase